MAQHSRPLCRGTCEQSKSEEATCFLYVKYHVVWIWMINLIAISWSCGSLNVENLGLSANAGWRVQKLRLSGQGPGPIRQRRNGWPLSSPQQGAGGNPEARSSRPSLLIHLFFEENSCQCQQRTCSISDRLTAYSATRVARTTQAARLELGPLLPPHRMDPLDWSILVTSLPFPLLQ